MRTGGAEGEMWLLSLAFGYEVDAWTPHTAVINDSASVASGVFDAQLDNAIAQVSRRCPSDPDVLFRRVAKAVAKESAKRVRIDRPGMSAFGNGVYSAYLEVDPLIDRVSTGREGVFADVTARDSFVLHYAGAASTVRFGDVLLGTDKVDHFLATGYQYLRWSRYGEDPDRAIRRGTRTERRMYGQMTSKSFSYGDLAANWDGYQFYVGLLGEESLLQVDTEGCVERVDDWDWTTWATPAWDEFVNPSVYGERVQEALKERLEPDRDQLCAMYAPSERMGPWNGKAPIPEGPLGLGDWCSDTAAPPEAFGGGAKENPKRKASRT